MLLKFGIVIKGQTIARVRKPKCPLWPKPNLSQSLETKKKQYGCQAAILKMASLKNQPIHGNAQPKLGIAIQSQTKVIIEKPKHRIWPPGARPTTAISIEFEIQWNFVMLLFITYSSDHNKMLHKVDTAKFDRISNSIEIPLLGRAQGSHLKETSKGINLYTQVVCYQGFE